MGGINCGQSNDRHKGTTGFVKQYADITRGIFKVIATVSNANVEIENLVLNETDNSETSLLQKDTAIDLLIQAENQLDSVQNSIRLAIAMLEPVFRQPELKDGFIKPYWNKDQHKSYKFWLKHGLIVDNLPLYAKVVALLKDNGEIAYLEYLNSHVKSLQVTLNKLKVEYMSENAKTKIANGTLQLAIRDAENQVTALTAKSLSQIALITGTLTAYCLVEYSSQTSISGQKPTFSSFTVSTLDTEFEQDDL